MYYRSWNKFSNSAADSDYPYVAHFSLLIPLIGNDTVHCWATTVADSIQSSPRSAGYHRINRYPGARVAALCPSRSGTAQRWWQGVAFYGAMIRAESAVHMQTPMHTPHTTASSVARNFIAKLIDSTSCSLRSARPQYGGPVYVALGHSVAAGTLPP